MKNHIRCIICIILCFCVCLGICGCSCNGNNDENINGNNENIETIYLDREPIEGMLHEFKVSPSDVSFVKDGKTDYVIIYPKSLEDNTDLKFAISELQYFMNQSAGISLGAEPDNENINTEKIISLGSTVQSQNDKLMSSLLRNTELKDNGFIIKTKGNSVYIMGNTPLSWIWGVYEFLHQEVNYQYFAEDCYTLDKGITNLNLKDMEIKDVPDIQYNVNGNGEDCISVTHYRRLKMTNYYDFYVSGTPFCHNTFDLVDASTRAKHPEWVATTGLQLCYSKDQDNLARYIFNQIKELFIKDPYHNYVPIMHEDGGYWCTCDKCTAEYGKYDDDRCANVALMIRFYNKVADRLKEWNEENCPERDLKIVMIAYGPLNLPPVKLGGDKKPELNSDGSYQPYSDELILRDNVMVQIAGGVIPIGYSGNADVSGADEDYLNASNDSFYRWKAIANEFLAWSYSANFANYFAPRDDVSERDDLIRFYIDRGIILWFDNAKYDSNYSSDFGVLKSYINSRLAWDASLSLNKLIDEFFDNYFMDASTEMKKMYSEYRAYMDYLAMNNIYPKGFDVEAEQFPKQLILRFLGYMEKAQQEIEPLKETDFAKYTMLSNRILRETLTWKYLYYSLHSEMFEYNTLQQKYTEFLNECYKVGITSGCEHQTIKDFLNK